MPADYVCRAITVGLDHMSLSAQLDQRLVNIHTIAVE